MTEQAQAPIERAQAYKLVDTPNGSQWITIRLIDLRVGDLFVMTHGKDIIYRATSNGYYKTKEAEYANDDSVDCETAGPAILHSTTGLFSNRLEELAETLKQPDKYDAELLRLVIREYAAQARAIEYTVSRYAKEMTAAHQKIENLTVLYQQKAQEVQNT